MALFRLSFLFLAGCAIIYVAQLGFAVLMMAVTSPPICHINFTGWTPAAVCTRFGWSFEVQHLFSLPGAILTYPLEIAPSAANPVVLANPVFLMVMAIHLFAWIHIFQLISGHLRNR